MHIEHLLEIGVAVTVTAALPAFAAEATLRGAFEPAMDLGLYLGVPAHAVFVSTDDLGYVHAHAMAADAPKGSHTSHGSNEDPKAVIPAKLMLHATPPRACRYALWIQFKGRGQMRTVPFVVTVPAAP